MTTAIAKPSSLSRTISVTVEVDLDVIEYGKGYTWWPRVTVSDITEDAERLLAKMVRKSLNSRLRRGWMIRGFKEYRVSRTVR